MCSKYEVTIPPVTVNKEATVTVKLWDSNHDVAIGGGEKLSMSVSFDETDEPVIIKPIRDVGGGKYEASFIPSRCGYYIISMFIGHHIQGSSYK